MCAVQYSLAALLLIAIASASGQTTVRWYQQDQVQQGQQLFKHKCAKCHGINAEGEPDWRKPDADGEYPPPPLNDDAYAWHHTLDQLREQVHFGSKSADGEMPSFDGKLNSDEIDAVIAYFQSKWSDRTYQIWQSRQILSATRHLREQQEPSQHPGTYWLKQHLGSVSDAPGVAMKTPAKGIREVRVRDDYVYLSEDGRYAFTGHMIDLRDGTDLTLLNRAMETKNLLKTFPVGDMLLYPAQGHEKTKLTIFTDTSCSYCRKMHREIPRFQSEGVSVRYIPYPRRGLDGKGYAQLKLIWCSEDPVQALSTYVETRDLPDPRKECIRAGAVEAGYHLGNSLGISGTPFQVLENGETIKGFKPASEVLERLKIDSEPG